MNIKRIAGLCLRKLIGFERFVYYKALWKFKSTKITDKEEEDFFYFLNMIKEDDNILDIGANVGVMTSLLARKAVKGRVFSFEPVPVTFKILQRMVNRNKLKNVKIYNAAVGNENTIVHMNIPVFNGLESDVGSYVMQDIYYFNNTNVVKVDVNQITIDTFNELKGVKINAIKIDIENYEYYALAGAGKLLREQRPIVFSEIWYGSENQKNVFELMAELDYSILIFNGKSLLPFNPAEHNKLNYFFIPKEMEGNLVNQHDKSI